MPDTTDDFKEWGDQWVYCRQHRNVHKTGWCTVSISDKVAIGANLTHSQAMDKAKNFGLDIIEPKNPHR